MSTPRRVRHRVSSPIRPYFAPARATTWRLTSGVVLAVLPGCSAQELPSAGRPQAEASATRAEAPPSNGQAAASAPATPDAATTHAGSEPSPNSAASADSVAHPGAPAASVTSLNAAQPQADATPVLLDASGAPLPQTDARPTTESPAFLQGGQHLFAAIVADDAERALRFFFPVVAYEQVKAIAKPARDWERRLVAAFKRNIHGYHKKLGTNTAGAQFVRIEVPEAKVQWMKPGSEGNKLGYFRVLRSNLVYRDAAGKEAKLGITSMISWRGEWYVVHLDGFE